MENRVTEDWAVKISAFLVDNDDMVERFAGGVERIGKALSSLVWLIGNYENIKKFSESPSACVRYADVQQGIMTCHDTLVELAERYYVKYRSLPKEFFDDLFWGLIDGNHYWDQMASFYYVIISDEEECIQEFINLFNESIRQFDDLSTEMHED